VLIGPPLAAADSCELQSERRLPLVRANGALSHRIIEPSNSWHPTTGSFQHLHPPSRSGLDRCAGKFLCTPGSGCRIHWGP
jgi:hypothetical protein